MKAKNMIVFLLVIGIVFFGAMSVALADDEVGSEGNVENTSEVSGNFVKARLISVNSANSYSIILNGQEMIVNLYGLDFTEPDFYISDRKHDQYAKWLLVSYQYVWVDYDENRVNERGNPLVYLHYGPWDTELWSSTAHAGHTEGQSGDVLPKRVSFWGDPLEVYDHNPVEPFIADPQFSTVFDNWSPNYDPTKFGGEFKETYTAASGNEFTRTWYLRDLNRLMLRSGYADVTEEDFSRKAEYKDHVAVAKWCRRGVWSMLLKPAPENEDQCGVNKPLN